MTILYQVQLDEGRFMLEKIESLCFRLKLVLVRWDKLHESIRDNPLAAVF